VAGGFFQAFRWSVASELASKAIQPLTFIALARLLTPVDLGVIAAAMMVTSFSQVLWEAGVGKAIIQRQDHIAEAANAAFWMNVALGAVVSAILLVSADAIAGTFFNDTRVADVLRLMTVQIMFGSLSACYTALLQKEMRFKALFWVRFATVALPGIVAVPLALMGASYWSVVYGGIAGQVVQTIILWQSHTWRPQLSFSKGIAADVARFGSWVTVTGVLGWFYIWADALIVGMYLGSHELGVYRTGNQVAIMVYSLIFTPVLPVLYAKLSDMGASKEKISSAMELVIPLLAALSIPIAFAGFVLAEPLSPVVFGEGWNGIGMVISAMMIAHGYSWITGMNGEAYRALGKPQFESIVMVFALPIYMLTFIVAIKHGLEVFLLSRIVLSVISFVVHLIVASYVFNINFTRTAWVVSTITIICLVARYLLLMKNDCQQIAFEGGSFASIVLFLLAISFPSFFIISKMFRENHIRIWKN
jgi:O-antigen/teichoic acid export membrane protein